jgi:hypothetical protein
MKIQLPFENNALFVSKEHMQMHTINTDPCMNWYMTASILTWRTVLGFLLKKTIAFCSFGKIDLGSQQIWFTKKFLRKNK